MMRKNVIRISRKKLFIFAVFLMICLISILCLRCKRRVCGQILVEKSGSIVDSSVECLYFDGTPIKTKCKTIPNGIDIQGFLYGAGGIYRFMLSNSDIVVQCELEFDKRYYDRSTQWIISIQLHKLDTRWDATVTGRRTDILDPSLETTVKCIDIEKNGISLIYNEESGTLINNK